MIIMTPSLRDTTNRQRSLAGIAALSGANTSSRCTERRDRPQTGVSLKNPRSHHSRSLDRWRSFKAASLIPYTLAIASGAMFAPGSADAQSSLVVDNNTTVTASPGSVTWAGAFIGVNSGTVGGVPGGTYIVPAGSNVTLSTATALADLVVGQNANSTGLMTISGQMLLANMIIGFNAGSSGVVQVNGGTITSTYALSQYYIGFSGQGTLSITNGGSVTSIYNTIVGYQPGSEGTLNVDGAGSSFSNAGFFVVGANGIGHMNVTNGGLVIDPAGTIQIGGNNAGDATVSGTGSRLVASSYIGVGVGPGGVGTLTITNGGAATATNGIYIGWDAAYLNLAAAKGTIIVNNGGTLTGGVLADGTYGTGDLQIQSGGTATFSGTAIVGSVAGTSSIEVGGPGATLNVQGGKDLILGAGGNGVMTVSNQGTVNVTNGGNTIISGLCNAADILSNFCSSSTAQGGSGTVTVTDSGTTLNAGASLVVGQYGPGALTIANGAQVNASTTTVAQNAGSTGALNIGAPSGSAPAAPGTLNTPTVTFGAGNGDLVFNHTDTSGNYVFAPVVTGGSATTSAVDAISGTTVMSGASDYFGRTTVYDGAVLAAGGTGVFSVNSDYTVQSGGTLNLNGYSQTVASATNAGLINMGNGTPPVTTLTTPNYIGQGGTIALNTYLGTDGSPSDKLVINGGSASGTSKLRIMNAGGPGALTTANGILVVETTNGGTTSPTAFSLDGRAVAGVYEYRLFRGPLIDPVSDDWYLRSEALPLPPPNQPLQPLYRPEVPAYLANQRLASEMFVHSLHDRLGEPQYIEGQGFNPDDDKPRSGWLRVVGNWVGSRTKDGIFSADTDSVLLHGGFEVAKWKLFNDADRAHLGVMASYGYASTTAHAESNPYSARGKVEGWSLGAYGTWYQNDEKKLGAYVDTWFQYGWFNNRVEGDLLPVVTYSSHGLAISGETGYAMPVHNDWIVEPQAQLIYLGYNQGDVTEQNGTQVTGANSHGWISRLGVRFHRTFVRDDTRKWQPYLTLNWWHSTASNTISFDGVPESNLYPANRYEVKIGVNADFRKRWTGWANVSGAWGSQSFHQYAMRVGMKYTW